MSIEPAEYRARQATLARALRERGLAGALVVSRGGGTFDRSANVLYLSGHYQSYAYLPETPGLFSGRSHAALALGADGRSVLCMSVPELDRDRVTVDDVRYGESFAATVAEAVRAVAGADAPIGLVGGDVVPLDMWQRIADRLDGRPTTQVDELVETMRRRKSPAEQEVVRAAASTGRRAVTALLKALRPGARESDAVGAAAASAIADGAGLYFATASSGPATGRYASSALPGWSTRRLEEGDLVRFDLGIVQEGYLCDFGRSAVVGSPSPDQARLLTALHGALDQVIAAVRPGVSVADVVATGDAALAAAGVATTAEVAPGTLQATYPAHWGHGLGLGWERPWLVGGETLSIEPGMVLAVERAISLDGVGTAAAEQNLLVTEDGAEVLTEGPDGRWS